jgi:hypothetical protein
VLGVIVKRGAARAPKSLVLVASGSSRAWKITAAGRLMLAPRRSAARERPVIRRGPHPR